MEDLKKEILQRIPETQKRINELEKKLKKEITDWKKEKLKPDYVG